MPVIGRTGEVQFRREASYSQPLERTAVDVANKRFSGLSGLIATGDKVRIAGSGGIPLDRNSDGYADSPGGHAMYNGAGFSQGPRTDHRTASSAAFYEADAGSSTFYDTSASTGLTTSFDCYISVNDLGYGKLHGSFADAVNGDTPLTLFDETTPFTINALEQEFNLAGQVTNYTLNTSRQSLDIEAIGEVFGESMAGKVTGSGSINCFFTYREDARWSSGFLTKYLYELALRTAQGQDGTVKLYVNKGAAAGESIYYMADIVITQTALNIQPDQIVAGTIDFVTSGEIVLRVE